MPCRNCGTRFEDKHIGIIGTFLHEGYFIAVCHQCENRMLISVTSDFLQRSHNGLKKQNRRYQESHIRTISPDDVLDMRNFLKNFDGDFINLFDKKA